MMDPLRSFQKPLIFLLIWLWQNHRLYIFLKLFCSHLQHLCLIIPFHDPQEICVVGEEGERIWMTLVSPYFPNGKRVFQERLSLGIFTLGDREVCEIAQGNAHARMVEAEDVFVDNKSTPPKRLGSVERFLQKEEPC